jgi:2,3-bisphosphoglycerate-independent phosphoglycerate mutase
VKIDQSIKKRQFHSTDKIVESCKHAKETSGRLHVLGLISDGGVHSHITHLFALLETAKEQGVPNVYIHFFGDGRDTAPTSGSGYLKQLLDFISDKNLGYGKLGSVTGRYYAMDRDKRWERIKIAIDGLVRSQGERTTDEDVVKVVEERYKKDEGDEFLKPIIVGDDERRIKDGDTLFFFNYRSDRMRQIISVFGLDEKPTEIDVPKNLHITTMSRYSLDYPFPVAFPPQPMTNVLAEWLSKQGTKQCHIAETEKYAHVTFFFNGGVEKQFKNEDRHLIPSPKVPTYDHQPEMSAQGVADKVAEVVKSDKYEFVMCNFAPPDMVGHTGKYDAAVKAITATDHAVGTVAQACEEAGYILVITADHGNAEQMKNPENGEPHTAHTTNPVPLIIKTPSSKGEGSKLKLVKDEDRKDGEELGALCDVAPTILDIMGLPIPEEMSGRSLLQK